MKREVGGLFALSGPPPPVPPRWLHNLHGIIFPFEHAVECCRRTSIPQAIERMPSIVAINDEDPGDKGDHNEQPAAPSENAC